MGQTGVLESAAMLLCILGGHKTKKLAFYPGWLFASFIPVFGLAVSRMVLVESFHQVYCRPTNHCHFVPSCK